MSFLGGGRVVSDDAQKRESVYLSGIYGLCLQTLHDGDLPSDRVADTKVNAIVGL